jgi:hypothetical protein
MCEFIINNTIRVTGHAEDKEHKSIVSYAIYYPVNAPEPVIRRRIHLDEKQTVVFNDARNFILRGEISLIAGKTEVALYGDIYYGPPENKALQHHVNGTLLVFPTAPVPPPFHPHPDNPGNAGAETMITAPLFPYVDLSPWPAPSPHAIAIHLVSYRPDPGNDALLYNQLLTAVPLPGSRKKIETICLQFLGKESPFEGQYLGSLSNVPLPFCDFPGMYDFLIGEKMYRAAWLMEHVTALVDEPLTGFLQSEWYENTIQQLWQNYFALTVFPGYDQAFAIDLTKILVICHFLEGIAMDEQAMLHASILLPAALFPLPPQEATGMADKDYIRPYAVGQLKMVRYALSRYEPGEIAHIENVLKGEQKKYLQRNRTLTTATFKEHNHTENRIREELNESSSDLVRVAKTTLAGYTKTRAYDKFDTTYGPPTEVTLNGTWVTTLAAATAPDTEERSDFAKKILDHTVNHISDHITEKRSFSRLSETENVHTSILDNRQGAQHFRGIYRWLNKVYHISQENYGYRFMLEIKLCDPARSYIQSQQRINSLDLLKPLSPAEKGISHFDDITRDNYLTLLSYYHVDQVPLPPAEVIYVNITLKDSDTVGYASIPEGYGAVSASIAGVLPGDITLSGLAGSKIFTITSTSSTVDVTLSGESGTLPVSVMAGSEPGGFIVNAALLCQPLPATTDAWKILVWQQINTAWQQALTAYDTHITSLACEDDIPNTLLLRNLEQTIIQQRCQALLMELFMTRQGGDPGMMYAQFFSQAFEWNELTFTLDDDPWKYNTSLKDKSDSLRPFLQATTATVFLPVIPAQNFRVLYYLSAGILWELPDTFTPVNEKDLAIALALKHVPHWHGQVSVERTWEIKLPTEMQVIDERNRLPYFSSPLKPSK